MEDDVLRQAAEHSVRFRKGLHDRSVHATATLDELRAALGGPLPSGPTPAERVIDDLVGGADAGVVAMAGGRYFGFVIGSSLPAAVAADWLTSAWDQNAGLFVGGPAVTVVEEVAGGWLRELLGLPAHASSAFVTGCQMAHVTALAAARHHVLSRNGWDVALHGLQGAPRIRVLVGDERHVTVDRALRFLGIGSSAVVPVGADDQGRMDVDGLRTALERGDGPTIVCAQLGNVNTGAFDPVGAICDAAQERGAWVHVDGAFGLWAAASPSLRHLVGGHDRADSWATDGHKWLNVPYDSGLAFVAHPAAHRAAMAVHAAYLEHADDDGPREPMDWTPEFSRRARALPVWAAIRNLGSSGVAHLVERCCRHARRFAAELAGTPGVEVLNDVVLNQVLVRFLAADGNHDARTVAVIRAVQDDGTCWMSGTTWHGMTAMRISVSSWATTDEDVERSVAAIRRITADAASVTG